MATQTEIRDRLNVLSARAQGVIAAETAEQRAHTTHQNAIETLRRAQDQYDKALEAALEVFPQLATGFNLNPETVGIGPDGKVHVMPQEAS